MNTSVFRTKSKIYDGVFLEKQLTAIKSRQLFLQK